MSYLAPHPWDAIGLPPAPGSEYRYEPPVEWTEQVAKIDKLIRAADELDDEANEKRSEADSDEEAATERRDEANEIIEEEIEPTDPDYAKFLRQKYDL